MTTQSKLRPGDAPYLLPLDLCLPDCALFADALEAERNRTVEAQPAIRRNGDGPPPREPLMHHRTHRAYLG